MAVPEMFKQLLREAMVQKTKTLKAAEEERRFIAAAKQEGEALRGVYDKVLTEARKLFPKQVQGEQLIVLDGEYVLIRMCGTVHDEVLRTLPLEQ